MTRRRSRLLGCAAFVAGALAANATAARPNVVDPPEFAGEHLATLWIDFDSSTVTLRGEGRYQPGWVRAFTARITAASVTFDDGNLTWSLNRFTGQLLTVSHSPYYHNSAERCERTNEPTPARQFFELTAPAGWKICGELLNSIWGRVLRTSQWGVAARCGAISCLDF